MAMLIDGHWHKVPVTRGAADDEGGRFVRRPSSFRASVDQISASQMGRHRLYVSLACPWAHRTLIVRELKGLSAHIPISVVDFFMSDEGWAFEPADTATGATHLRDLYLASNSCYTGKVTVPVLWDTQQKKIVNNESLDIIIMLDQHFPSARPQLYPPALRAEIDAMIAANYEAVNNGVYRAGFAGTQTAYDEAVVTVFDRLDSLDALLERRRHLVGDQLTLADVCLFTTLLRFDAVYYSHFKCNLRRIEDFQHLAGYVRDIYQRPGVAALCDFQHIKGHYYLSHEKINPTRIVPMGPTLDFERDHRRAHLP